MPRPPRLTGVSARGLGDHPGSRDAAGRQATGHRFGDFAYTHRTSGRCQRRQHFGQRARVTIAQREYFPARRVALEDTRLLIRALLNTGGHDPPDVPLRPPQSGGEPLVRPAR